MAVALAKTTPPSTNSLPIGRLLAPGQWMPYWVCSA
jgi:hypothetical protein